MQIYDLPARFRSNILAVSNFFIHIAKEITRLLELPRCGHYYYRQLRNAGVAALPGE
jgi:hypothetical protein